MRIIPAQNDVLQMLVALVTLIFMGWSLKCWPAFHRFDQRLHNQIPNRQNSLFWRAVAFIGQPKLTVGYAFILAGLVDLTADSITALWVLATLGSLDAIGIGVKRFFKRQRPQCHLSIDDGYSFPSGHVLGTTVLVLMIWALWPTPLIGMAGLIWLLLVVVSRLVLRAHYPSDVFSTMVMAAGWVALFRRMYAPMVDWLIRLF
ncbi:phosphatase PAP2 family protein [Limosilactobacillus mucosae]